MRGNGRHKRSPVVALILVTVLLTSVAATSSAQGARRVKVLIAFTQPPGPAEQALVWGVGGEVKYSYRLVPAIAASVPEAALDALRRNPNVAAVEPDLVTHISDAELDSAWGVKRIGAGLVHAQGNVGAGVKVGILDSGIDLDHPDLTYDPSCSASFVEGETLDDGNSHGTHVAGTIAGLDNDSGVVGGAPGATLCIYKVFDSAGNANYSDIVAAVERAVDDGVQIANHSWGDPEDPGTTVKAAFDTAYAAGMLHVAAAGNNGNWFGWGTNCIYPALWGTVIATAATTQSDTRAFYSSTCPEVELAAPGDLIYSTLPGGGYGIKSGTSMASPHAAGTAALVLAAHPDWSNDQLRAQLQATADDLGDPGRDPLFGYGLVDADEAAASPNNPPVADDQAVTTDEDTPVAVVLAASDAENDPLTFTIVAGPAHGVLSGTAPDLTYTPDANYHGLDSFTFVTNDGQANSNVAVVSITVNPVNDAPVADDQAVTTDEDTSVAITLSGSDPDGDSLTYSVVSAPAFGALAGMAPHLTYTPDVNYHGSDGFAFVANDGQVDSNVAMVSITVNSVNDAPSAAFNYSCAALSCVFDASGSSDPEQGIISYEWGLGDGSTGSGMVLSHDYAAAGTYDVALTVTDGGGASDTEFQAVTLSQAPSSMHIGDLDGNLASASTSSWWAEVRITVHDQDEAGVVEATVQGTWSGGASGSGSCLTGTDGTCTVLSPEVPTGQETITFVVDGVAHAALPYQPAENHDPDGDSDGTSITASHAGNQPPVAQFTSNCSELSCTFDGSGSFDPDGSIVSYAWDFGDGTSATEDNGSHTYTTAGTYTVVLTVTDNDNATSAESQNVSAGASPGTMFVLYIPISVKSAGLNHSATAVAAIHDTGGSPVAGATVYGTRSSDVSKNVSDVTAADGTVALGSGKDSCCDAFGLGPGLGP